MTREQATQVRTQRYRPANDRIYDSQLGSYLAANPTLTLQACCDRWNRRDWLKVTMRQALVAGQKQSYHDLYTIYIEEGFETE